MAGGMKLSREQRDGLIREIKAYYLAERDEELGELAASLILNFVIAKLAPVFYNLGVLDSYTYLNDRLEDLLGIQK